MLLILYDKKDLCSIDYIKYLEEKSCNFFAIEATDLVRNYSIYDNGEMVIWENKKEKIKIDFSKLSAIYYRLHELPLSLFEDYAEEDRFYVKKEWESYLIYRMNIFANCIGAPNLFVLSSIIMQYPFYYQKAKETGIQTPFHYISSDLQDLKSVFEKDDYEFIARSNVYHNTNFKTSTEIDEKTYGIIEKPEGEIIIVDVVGGEVFASKILNKEPINLIEKDKLQALSLAKKLKLELLQILMIQDGEKLTLMYLSAYPNWLKHNEQTKLMIYSTLGISLKICYLF